MAPPQSLYPLGKYLLELLKESRLSLEDFCVQALAYRNAHSGIKDFDDALKCGLCTTHLNRAIRRYTKQSAELNDVLLRNQQYVEAEAEQTIAEETEKERRSFFPHITADYESLGPSDKRPDESFTGTPTPVITIPPEVARLPFQQQLPLIKLLIQTHYASWGGITEYNERIDGYRGWFSFSDWTEVNFQLFDIEGNYLPEEPVPASKAIARRRRSVKRP
jgi:hypothetical protein